MSPAEAQVSSGLPWEQGLWLQQTREAQRVNPTKRPGRQPTNWIIQMSGQVSRGSAGEYQADEQAGVTRLSW